MRVATEEAYQNIRDILTIYQIYRRYIGYIVDILDILSIYRKNIEIFLKVFIKKKIFTLFYFLIIYFFILNLYYHFIFNYFLYLSHLCITCSYLQSILSKLHILL